MKVFGREESASISFNINIPSKIIREYFDGLAKVEIAKLTHKSASQSDMAPVYTAVCSMLTDYLNKESAEKEVVSMKVPSLPKDCCDKNTFEVLASFVQADVPEVPVSSDVKESDKPAEVPCEAPAKSSEPAVKKPAYQETEAESPMNGFGELFKMFGPMFQNMTSSLGAGNKFDMSALSKLTEQACPVAPPPPPPSSSTTTTTEVVDATCVANADAADADEVKACTV